MRVFKFGGASIRNVNSIKKVARIIQDHSGAPLLVVVSAMGKTTNELESIVSLSHDGKPYHSEIEALLGYHGEIIQKLSEKSNLMTDALSAFLSELTERLHHVSRHYDELYDQVVSLGEILSTQILYIHLLEAGLPVEWIDARKFIRTDSTFREGKVNWTESKKRIESLSPLLEKKILITQGFIGSTNNQLTTTLGREGSDFSAAIFASCLNAESVTIWKDVPGVMSADPKRLPDAVTFDKLPFKEAAEMTYYGASVIHPKTIKPLANQNIPLLVKNFDDVNLPGTRIYECKVDKLPPLVVFKENQCLISCQVTDYTFIDESQISIIFTALSIRGLKVNLIQNSAISFSFCIDYNENKIMALIDELSKTFEVYYNTSLTLITIKNFDVETFEKYRNLSGVILEQSSRSTLQVLIKSQ